MRIRLGLVVALLALATSFATPEPAAARDCSESGSCGTPSCWEASPVVRPGVARRLSVGCHRVLSAQVVAEPGGVVVSDVSIADGALHFTVAADDTAAGHATVRFTLTGDGGRTAPFELPLEIRPATDNSPPQCYQSDVEQRSPGDAPVEIGLGLSCWDPDGDRFVVTGQGAGTFPDSPMTVDPDVGGGWWRYRTATTSGMESATISAVDELGARSAPATFTVTIGPGIDRPAQCSPTTGFVVDGVHWIRTRPGAVRRFAISCFDLDSDPVVPMVLEPTRFGSLVPGPADQTWPGMQPVSYVPAGSGLQEDHFDVAARVGGRVDTVTPVGIQPVELPTNGWTSCGSGGGWVQPGQTAEVVAGSCVDDEGDPLTVELVEAPEHGTAGVPRVVETASGEQRVLVDYTPQDGFTGVDCLRVRLRDGHGFEQVISTDVVVERGYAGGPFPAPQLPTPYPLPSPVSPPIRPVAAGKSATDPRAVARTALGAAQVVRVPVMSGVTAWSPARLSRSRLTKDGRAPGLVVTCRGGCDLRSSAAWTGRGRRARIASRAHATSHLAPGVPQVVWATDPGPAGRPKLDLRVRVSAGGKRRAVRHRVALSRR